MKSNILLKKILFMLMLGSVAYAAVKSVPTSSVIRSAPLNAGMSDAEAQALPYFWMRLINILAKSLEVCDLAGNDRVLFVSDLNLVMKSPINERSALERIRFSRVLANAMRHRAFVGNVKSQTQLGSMNAYVQKFIAIDDYFEAINMLLGSKRISEKRSTEVLSYMWLVATTRDLSDDAKDTLRGIITNAAMPKMPAYQEDLQRILDLLNLQPLAPQVITKVIREPGETKIIREKAPEREGRTIFLTGHSGTASRRKASVYRSEDTAEERMEKSRAQRKEKQLEMEQKRAANNARFQAQRSGQQQDAQAGDDQF